MDTKENFSPDLHIHSFFSYDGNEKTETYIKKAVERGDKIIGFSEHYDFDCRLLGDTMRKYMIDKIAAQKHSSMVKMEKVPGLYAIYRNIFLKIMRKTDLQESVQNRGKDYFDVTIKKCLWHTACVENGCAELCRLFCDVDNVTYGGLNKIGFTRTKTLGYGGDCYDFHFFKK